MDLINYLLNIMIDEVDIIKELLVIDNKICHVNITYNELINTIKNTKYNENKIDSKFDIITDGNINSVVYALINYRDKIKKINIDNYCYSINKWLVTRVNEYLNCNIILEKDSFYNNYNNRIIIIGEEEFTKSISSIFPNALKVII